MDITITKELLFNYFRGGASLAQKKWIESWYQSPENEELFYKYLMEWELTNPQYKTEVTTAIERFMEAVSEPVETLPERADAELKVIRWYQKKTVRQIAASFLLLTSAGLFYHFKTATTRLATAPGQIKTWTLPDGSLVTLNANSQLTYPRYPFFNTERSAHLAGEAEFIIKHEINHKKFTVTTDNHLDVTVLGTEFTVFARSSKSRVLLNKGSVLIHTGAKSEKEQLHLRPGDLVEVNERGLIKKERIANPEELLAWKQHRFIFDKKPLSGIIEILKDNYSMDVVLDDPSLGELSVSGSFKAITADQLASSVATVLDLQVDRKNNIFYIARASK